MTRFEQFQQNVQGWAAEHGIYEHSTALAQALKAVSEVGELADAVIKGDREALTDAIGDVAVCLINVIAMCGGEVSFEPCGRMKPADLQESAGSVAHSVGDLAVNWYTGMERFAIENAREAIGTLELFARDAELNFDDCCEHAWQQIKDRKGHMVAGGAFVKEGV